MKSILSQIVEIAENEGIAIGALERKIGASKGVLSRAIAHNTDIQAKWLQIIVENYPRYNPEWLLTGESSMLRDGVIEIKAEEKKDIPVVEATSIGFILDRYEALAVENAQLKKENEELRNLVSAPNQISEYTISHPNIGSHIAAEPKPYK